MFQIQFEHFNVVDCICRRTNFMIYGGHGMFWLLWIIENLEDSVIYVQIFFFWGGGGSQLEKM